MRERCETTPATWRWWMLGLWVWLMVVGGIEPALAEPRTALVIGNGAYQKPKGSSLRDIRGAANDARDMAAELGRLGFDAVIQDIDVGKEAFENRVNEFIAALNRRGGVGLFYFSGHGAQVEGQNYLIPVDLPVSGETVSATDVRYHAVSASWVLDKMTERRGGINLIILDACRNEPKSKASTGDGGGLAPMTGPEGTLIAYSTAPGTLSADGGRNGLYTARLLEALRNHPGREINQLFRSIIRPVMEDSRPFVGTDLRTVQVPWISGSMPEDFYFASKDIDIKPQLSTKQVISNPDAWETLKGNWKISDGSLLSQGGKIDSEILYKNLLPNNYMIEVDTMPLDGAGKSAVIFCYMEKNHFHQFEISASDSAVFLWESFNWRQINTVKMPIIYNAWYRLKLIIENNRAFFFINDKPVFTEEISCKKNHLIGLRSAWTTSRFKNFTITIQP